MSRKSKLALLGLMALTAPQAAFAQQFEGVIKQRTIRVDLYALSDRDFDMSEAIFDVPADRILALRDELEADGAMTVEEATIYVKGNHIRSDMVDDEGPAYATTDLTSGVIRLFRPSEQMYIEWTKEDMERMAGMTGGMPMSDTGEMEATATGETRTINGMNCTAYDVETDEGTTRVWVSKDDAALADALLAMGERVNAMNMGDDEVDESFVVAKHGFPVLIQRLEYDSYEIEETMSVDRQSVSDDLFTPPTGWRKMSMADMMQIRD